MSTFIADKSGGTILNTNIIFVQAGAHELFIRQVHPTLHQRVESSHRSGSHIQISSVPIGTRTVTS